MKIILKYLSAMTLFTTVMAEDLPTKDMSIRTDVSLTRLYDMNSNYQNDIESHTEISNAGSTWVRRDGKLIGIAPSVEYNENKRIERKKLGKNAHVKSMPIISFPIPSEYNKNEKFGYTFHLFAKSEGEDHRKGYGIKTLTGGAHDATLFSFDEKGLSIKVHSKKRSINEVLATDESLKYERGKWYEFYFESNRENVVMKVRDTTTNKTVVLEGKHPELNRHNKRMNVSGIHNLQILSLTGLDFSYYESF